MNWTAVGATLMGLGVLIGAFGGHILKERLDSYSYGVYEKAVFYQFVHAIGILLIALLGRTGAISPAGQTRAAWLLFAGILLFSGSLYTLALTGQRVLGAVTPLGGLAFAAGWLVLAFEALRSPRG
jgi:uncharacterized membrane protein YgdD (TMEM256/DUF423 family)